MSQVLRNMPKEDVRRAAGHNLFQWRRFYIFTREEAKKLVEEDPKRTWPLVPANVKIQLKDRVNDLLANESIPTIQDEDILSWRMSLAVRDAIVSAANKVAPAAIADAQSPRALAYDPVRDI